MKKLIYISGPYTNGDIGVNIKNAIDAAEVCIDRGDYPLIPHLSHFWHVVSPHNYEFWMALDLKYIERCDMLIRLPGISGGSDREVVYAMHKGIPVRTLEEYKNGKY